MAGPPVDLDVGAADGAGDLGVGAQNGILDGRQEVVQVYAQLIGSASDVAELGEALGMLYLEQGDYAKAVSSFGAAKTNNAALAQILTKDYSKASQTLNAVTRPDATTDYLKAIVSARTNDAAGVISHLKAAISKKKSLAREAANDLEFAKYAKDAAFTNLVR